MKKDKGLPYFINPNVRGFTGEPEDCFELINQYGTYNIQPTADTENVFPAIAQGLAEGFVEKKNTAKEQELR